MPRPGVTQTVASEKQRLYGQPLTADERKVLQLIVWNYSMPEIADELGITERLARYRSDCIRYKAGVQFKRDLVMYARMTQGLKSLVTKVPR